MCIIFSFVLIHSSTCGFWVAGKVLIRNVLNRLAVVGNIWQLCFCSGFWRRRGVYCSSLSPSSLPFTTGVLMLKGLWQVTFQLRLCVLHHNMLQSLGKVSVDNFVADNWEWLVLDTGGNFISGPPGPRCTARKGQEPYGYCLDTKTVAIFKWSISLMIS